MAVLGPLMLTGEQAVEIRVLKRQGKGVRAIARELGVSHMTVRRYLKNASARRYSARKVRVRKLDPFHEYLQARVDAAHPHWIPATVLLREVKEVGYAGGISQLKAFLVPLKHVTPEPWTQASQPCTCPRPCAGHSAPRSRRPPTHGTHDLDGAPAQGVG